MLFYDLLAKEGVLLRSEVSYHSLYRFLRQQGLARPNPDDAPPKDRRKFVYDEVNRMWQGDAMVGPKVLAGGKMLFGTLTDRQNFTLFDHQLGPINRSSPPRQSK
jgi:hypothetical protein